MPGAVERFSDLGVGLDGRPFRGIAYVGERHRAEARFRGAPGLGVRRTTLQNGLLAAIARAGIPIVAERVTDIVQSADYVQAGVASRAVPGRRRRAALADPPQARPGPAGDRAPPLGAASALRVRAVDGRGRGALAAVDADGSLRGLRDPDQCRPGRGRPADREARFVRGSSGRVPGACASGWAAPRVVRRWAPDRCDNAAALGSPGRVLLVGDAAGYVDALTGEGIAVGLASAEVLVGCLAAGRPGDYERQWRSASRRYRGITAGLLWTRRQRWLAPAIVPAAARFPPVFATAVGQLAK